MRRSRWPFFRDVVGSSAASRPVRRSVKGKRPLWDCVGLPRGQGFLGLGGQCMQSYGSPMECLGTIPGPTRPNLISEVTNRPVKGHLETPKGLRTGGPGSDALVTLCASDHCFRPPSQHKTCLLSTRCARAKSDANSCRMPSANIYTSLRAHFK